MTINNDDLYVQWANIIYELAKIIHKFVMRFDLIIMSLKVINKGVRLIFTTHIGEIIILSLRATCSV